MKLLSNFTIRHPETKQDFDQYYRVRYETLRKPWGQPKGSEVDPTDNDSIHAFLLDHENAIAVCRLHFNDENQGQIRYMGVDEKYRGKGLGAAIVEWVESLAKKKGATNMILHARENAIPFYLKQGYEIKEKSYLLFGEIQHFAMVKQL